MPKLLSDEAVRTAIDGFRQLAVILDVLVERDLLRAMPAAPPSLAVPGLVHDNAVDPRPEARVPTEGVDRPEDPQEDFL